MTPVSPCLRVSVVKKRRRGQTIIIAIAILFLLVLLGATFVTMVVRNLQRVSRHGATDEALTQALAGVQYAANQFRTSELGADWRPRMTETMWRDPNPVDASNNPDPALAALRKTDYDFQWLDAASNGGFPYVRVPNGRGHFLLRVTYVPHFTSTAAAPGGGNGKIDEFDANSGLIHIESIGRGFEVVPGDPTTTSAPDVDNGDLEKSEAASLPSRKVEAWVPVGLTDQLWWITNNTGERGPAQFGVPPTTNPSYDPRFPTVTNSTTRLNEQYVSYPAVYEGSVRSDVDLNINGATVFRLYPSRGESLFVKGNINIVAQPKPTGPQVVIQVVDDNQPSPGNFNGRPILPGDDQGYRPTPFSAPGPTLIDTQALASSTNPNFDNLLASAYTYYNLGHDPKTVVQDEAHARTDTSSTTRTTREVKAPNLDQLDATTGVSRWLRATRDSGATIQVTDGATTRVINTGWYGITDQGGPQPSAVDAGNGNKDLRASGLYFDNFGDIQYAGDRAKVKDDWLRRGTGDLTQRGWLSDYYIPSVSEGGTTHPVLDLYLTQKTMQVIDPVTKSQTTEVVPSIRATRYDLDQRQLNMGDAAGKRRVFYQLKRDTNGKLVQSGGVYQLEPAVQQDPISGQAVTDPSGNSISQAFTRDFDYPANGIIYCEGSVRVHGVIGGTADGVNNVQGVAKQLTIVSGGTVYIEGNLVKPLDQTGNVMRNSFLGLLAHDYVTLNPTAFNRIQPGNDVVIERDPAGTDTKPGGYHFVIPQGGDLDFSFAASDAINQAVIHLKHTAKAEDASSETAVNIFLPSSRAGWPDWFQDRFNVGASQYNPSAAPNSQLYYLFHQILPPLAPGQWSMNVAESNNQTSSNSPGANYEYKSFLPPSVSSDGTQLLRGLDATFRMLVGYKDGKDASNNPIATLEPNGQPYWLSRVAVTPPDRPLPIKIEAVMYAYTGSWFIIPPPFFNDNPVDTRAALATNGKRAAGTFPNLDVNAPANLKVPGDATPADAAPFYNEALNIDVDIHGSITENMPAEPGEVALWTSRMWTQDTGAYDPTALPLNQPQITSTVFRPYIHYRYDEDLRRMVRARTIKTNAVEVAWTAPGAAPTGMNSLAAVAGNARTNNNSYVETLPVLPGLPSSALIYEGNPL